MNERQASQLSAPPSSFLGRLLGIVLSIALLVLGAMFSLVALAVVAVVGTLFAGWLWWKTRSLRREMQKMAEMAGAPQQAAHTANSAIIEGEWIREDAAGVPGRQTLR